LSLALAGFRVLSDREITIDGELALELRVQWLAEGRPMQQTQVSLFHQLESGPRLVLQIAATTTGGEQAKWDPVFQQMLQSVALRRKQTPAQEPVPMPHYPTTY